MQVRENPRAWPSNDSGVERAKEECQTRVREGVPLDILQRSANSSDEQREEMREQGGEYFNFFFSPFRSLLPRMPAEDSGKMFVCAIERGRWACDSRTIMRTCALFKRSMPPRRPLETACCLHLCSRKHREE